MMVIIATAGTVAVGATIAANTAIAAAATQAYGQYQSNKQAQAQSKSQSAWNVYNSQVSRREADAEQAANLFEAKQKKKAGERLKARGRAIRGASGVEAEGSPLLVMEDTAAELAKEQQQARISGTRRVSRFESQSILDISKASAAKARAAGFGRAAPISAGGTLLSGAGSAAVVAKG
jgi:hypothetical protein